MATLESYLETHVRQATTFDLAYVAAAHDAGLKVGHTHRDNVYGGEGEEPGVLPHSADALFALCDEWDATQWNVGMRTASLRQARAFVDALIDAFALPADHPLRALQADAAKPDSILHFVPALGYALAVLGASRAQACTLYLHGLARDQAAAAVRLGIVGPRAAQTLQANALSNASRTLGDAHGLPTPRAARRTAPLVETGQGGHGFLYSRLFQN
jgi:urease accessory protein UreF